MKKCAIMFGILMILLMVASVLDSSKKEELSTNKVLGQSSLMKPERNK